MPAVRSQSRLLFRFSVVVGFRVPLPGPATRSSGVGALHWALSVVVAGTFLGSHETWRLVTPGIARVKESWSAAASWRFPALAPPCEQLKSPQIAEALGEPAMRSQPRLLFRFSVLVRFRVPIPVLATRASGVGVSLWVFLFGVPRAYSFGAPRPSLSATRLGGLWLPGSSRPSAFVTAILLWLVRLFW